MLRLTLDGMSYCAALRGNVLVLERGELVEVPRETVELPDRDDEREAEAAGEGAA